ncbi:hypothetical protein [Rheinheimera sp. MMS21-TC3]|uniref:hypothetical protein n=1 Tax=Rheinheimera sp. MMS21-TC3 TaxID=3072790 RepID=UPI0028C47B2C|nr:hypothetical protein [Rheinheimera sp. MMS21-TC3]WNO61016.1 hypothetical protein RDV63_08645 [Rheinheimera sp. MMS21-TC3]
MISYISVLIIGLITMSSMNITDKVRLDELRVKTTVSGIYLQAWQAVELHLKANNYVIEYDKILVTFIENDSDYEVYLRKPVTTKILGGGGGICVVSKKDFSVKSCSFNR